MRTHEIRMLPGSISVVLNVRRFITRTSNSSVNQVLTHTGMQDRLETQKSVTAG